MASGDVRVRRVSGSWRVDLEGSQRAQGTFTTQSEAWIAGKAIARRKQVGAVLFGRDGRIREVRAPDMRQTPAEHGPDEGWIAPLLDRV